MSFVVGMVGFLSTLIASIFYPVPTAPSMMLYPAISTTVSADVNSLNQDSSTAITIDPDSLIATSSQFTISGSANGPHSITVEIHTPGKSAIVLGEITGIPVINGRWSFSLSDKTKKESINNVNSGTYIVCAAAAYYLEDCEQLVVSENLSISDPAEATEASTSSPKVVITNVQGHILTVKYSNLFNTVEGPAKPYTLYVQNEGWSKPILSLPLNGMTSGTLIFTLPPNAMPGDYSVDASGLLIQPQVGGVGMGDVAYGAGAFFNLSPNGVISIYATPPSSPY